MIRVLRFLTQYRNMHRRIHMQRKQLAALNKAVEQWMMVARGLAKEKRGAQ